ncbi:hypothetical protein ACIRQY_32015 [Streptomyces sp. NPDC101490]
MSDPFEKETGVLPALVRGQDQRTPRSSPGGVPGGWPTTARGATGTAPH